MKRLLVLSFFAISSLVAVDRQTQTPVDYANRQRPRPERRHIQERVHRSNAEQNFNNLNRRNSRDLSRKIRQAYDNRDVARLRHLQALAHRFAADAESRNNARFGTSQGFHREFSHIATRAEHYIQRLQHRPLKSVPFDLNSGDNSDSEEIN